MFLGAGLDEVHSDLGVLDPSGRAGALTLDPHGPGVGRPLARPVSCAAFLCAPLRWLLDDPEITFSVEADELVRKSDWACDVGPQVESGTGDRIGYGTVDMRSRQV